MTAAMGEEAQPVLRLSGISKRFGALAANDDISFTMNRGEVVALLGENGAGKTTLMNILFGHYVADTGSIEAFGRPLAPGDPRAALAAGIGMVHQHFTVAEQLTVLENIVLGTQSLLRPHLDLAGPRARVVRIAGDFGLAVDPDARIADLTVGERQRVEILKALYRDVRILILDEPTAVLTPGETEALFRTLKLLVERGLSILFITHKLAEVMAVSDRVLVLRHGRMVESVPTNQTDRAALAALLVGEGVTGATISPPPGGGDTLAELASVSTQARPGSVALQEVNLSLIGGEIVGLAGVSGNGQASLSAILEGREVPRQGVLRLRGRAVDRWTPRAAIAAGIGRIPEDRHATGMIGDMSVTENLISESYSSRRFSRFGLLDWDKARAFALEIIDSYGVKCPSPETRVRLLSGGNIQKLILGRALDGAPDIILANQPTRGLDIGALAYVHTLLLEARDRGAAVLLISEDLDEIMALSDRIHVIYSGRLSAPSLRGERSIAELGAWMSGHGFSEGDAHAA